MNLKQIGIMKHLSLRTALGALLLGCLGSSVAFSQVKTLSPAALNQIQQVYAFKATFTPAEQKMSSNLVLASRIAQGKSLGALAKFYVAPPKDQTGMVLVDVLGYATPGLLGSANIAGIDQVGGSKPVTNYQSTHLRAHVDVKNLAALAANPDVTNLREATGYIHNVGSVTSQGYVTEGANKVVATGVNGTGVRVGVLSDSALPARVAALIATGDLPPDVVIVPGQAGPTTGTNEGTAMMEIVHDLAPGAKLFFATADNGTASFAANIETLRFTYHCDIIVDDVSYFAESVFQDGPIAQAVNAVTADGALYFSSAANSGNLDSGSSGTWEGDFTPSGYALDTTKGLLSINNFGTPTSPSIVDELTSAPSSGVWLHWADPNGGSTNDYDLFIFDNTGSTLKAFSAGAQTGTQDPLEYVYPECSYGGYCPAAGDLIVVTLAPGSMPRAIHIDTERATLAIGTNGATFGHNAGASTFSLGAVYFNAEFTGAKLFTGGASDPIEFFSSDGPRKVFYNPDGTPITPGNYLFATQGGVTLIKPDAAATDGVSTATPGFKPFFGTSAAAPHAAAIAALVKSASPTLTNVQLRQALTSSALDIMAPGIDEDSGYGIVMAPAAVAAGRALAAAPASTHP
jgi:hypothetical protein